MKLWILKKIVLFLKWFSKRFNKEIRIYIAPKPKRVILYNKSNILFLGDFITFYKCNYVVNCHILSTQKAYEYANQNYDAAFQECNYMAGCIQDFLKRPKNTWTENSDSRGFAGFSFKPEPKYSPKCDNSTRWIHLRNIDNPKKGYQYIEIKGEIKV